METLMRNLKNHKRHTRPYAQKSRLEQTLLLLAAKQARRARYSLARQSWWKTLLRQTLSGSTLSTRQRLPRTRETEVVWAFQQGQSVIARTIYRALASRDKDQSTVGAKPYQIRDCWPHSTGSWSCASRTLAPRSTSKESLSTYRKVKAA